jgi:hypothetical protein
LGFEDVARESRFERKCLDRERDARPTTKQSKVEFPADIGIFPVPYSSVVPLYWLCE